ncbi:MAG TPA: hypothetical protein VIV11_39445, partial [Kofleriaceae bacterium]
MVRPIRVAILGGVAVALLVAAMFVVRPMPDSVVAWFGGVTGVERVGGVRVIYQPPAGLTSFHNTAAAGADVRRCRASD